VAYSISLLTRQPRPIFLVQLAETVDPELLRIKELDLLKEAARLAGPVVSFTDLISCGFRGVSWDQLGTVISTGIDVEPPDATIYVDGFDKALEYGGWPKVIVAIRNHCLDSTFREISGTTPEKQLADLQQVFRRKLQSADGTKLWLSRLPADDSRITTDYGSHDNTSLTPKLTRHR
jgi:hypothetical protein